MGLAQTLPHVARTSPEMAVFITEVISCLIDRSQEFIIFTIELEPHENQASILVSDDFSS